MDNLHSEEDDDETYDIKNPEIDRLKSRKLESTRETFQGGTSMHLSYLMIQ